jgi:hypothetical protein
MLAPALQGTFHRGRKLIGRSSDKTGADKSRLVAATCA